MMHESIRVGYVDVILKGNDRICSHIRKTGVFEPDTLAQFARLVRPGSTVIDVGCYSGLFAIAAVKMGARALGIEPMPENQKQIEANKALNHVEFPVFAGAATDRDGIGRLGYNDRVFLTSGASLERKSGPGHTVNLIRIDTLGQEDVSVIKIDVEGHEVGVLRGARDTLERYRPHLIVEANTEAEKQAIVAELGDRYELVSVLDTRNLILAPI